MTAILKKNLIKNSLSNTITYFRLFHTFCKMCEMRMRLRHVTILEKAQKDI